MLSQRVSHLYFFPWLQVASQNHKAPSYTIGKRQMGGGGNVSCDFRVCKRTIERALHNRFWRPQKVGLILSVPVPFYRSLPNDNKISDNKIRKISIFWGSGNLPGKTAFWDKFL